MATRFGRATTAAVWGLLLVGLGVAAGLLGPVVGPFGDSTDPVSPPTRAQAALDRLGQRIPGAADPTGWVVVVAPAGRTVDDPAVAGALRTLVDQLRDVPGVTAVVDPAVGGTVAADRRTAFVPVAVAASAVLDARPAVATVATAARDDGSQVEVGGVLRAPADRSGAAALLALVVAIGLAGLLARLILRSWGGAALALGTALVGAGVGVAVAILLGLAGSGSGWGSGWGSGAVAGGLGVAVGSAAAVLRHSHPGSHRGRRRAVAGGGALAVVATAGLAVTGVGAWAAAGAALALATAGALLAILTLAPAVMGLTGEPPAAPEAGPGRWARAVTGYPLRAILGGLGVVGVLALMPLLGVRFGPPPDPAQARLAAEFGPGAAGPLLLIVEVDRPAELTGALTAVAAQARQAAGVALAAPGRTAADGTLGVVTVLPRTGPTDPATRDLLLRLRADPAGVAGASVEVTGATAVAIDVADARAGAAWRYLLIIGPVLLVLLAVTSGPPSIGLAVAAGSVLSIGLSTWLALGTFSGVFIHDGGGLGADLWWAAVGLALLLALVSEQAARAAVVRTDHGAGRAVGLTALMVAVLVGGALLAAGSVPAAALVVLAVLVDALVVRLTLLPALAALLARPARHRGRHRG